MSPRTGRPKVENPKSNDVKVRLDEKTTIELNKYCLEHGITRAEAIRRGIHLLLGTKKEQSTITWRYLTTLKRRFLSMEYFNIKGNLFQVKIEGGYRNE